jgi:hypothetical protein
VARAVHDSGAVKMAMCFKQHRKNRNSSMLTVLMQPTVC